MNELIEGFAASKDPDKTTLGRCAFWKQELGHIAVDAITEDDIDAALARLAARGKMRCFRGQEPVQIGEPLKGSTINRYITAEQAERLIATAKVTDRTWKKLPVLLRLPFRGTNSRRQSRHLISVPLRRKGRD